MPGVRHLGCRDGVGDKSLLLPAYPLAPPTEACVPLSDQDRHKMRGQSQEEELEGVAEQK